MISVGLMSIAFMAPAQAYLAWCDQDNNHNFKHWGVCTNSNCRTNDQTETWGVLPKSTLKNQSDGGSVGCTMPDWIGPAKRCDPNSGNCQVGGKDINDPTVLKFTADDSTQSTQYLICGDLNSSRGASQHGQWKWWNDGGWWRCCEPGTPWCGAPQAS